MPRYKIGDEVTVIPNSKYGSPGYNEIIGTTKKYGIPHEESGNMAPGEGFPDDYWLVGDNAKYLKKGETGVVIEIGKKGRKVSSKKLPSGFAYSTIYRIDFGSKGKLWLSASNMKKKERAERQLRGSKPLGEIERFDKKQVKIVNDRFDLTDEQSRKFGKMVDRAGETGRGNLPQDWERISALGGDTYKYHVYPITAEIKRFLTKIKAWGFGELGIDRKNYYTTYSMDYNKMSIREISI